MRSRWKTTATGRKTYRPPRTYCPNCWAQWDDDMYRDAELRPRPYLIPCGCRDDFPQHTSWRCLHCQVIFAENCDDTSKWGDPPINTDGPPYQRRSIKAIEE